MGSIKINNGTLKSILGKEFRFCPICNKSHIMEKRCRIIPYLGEWSKDGIKFEEEIYYVCDKEDELEENIPYLPKMVTIDEYGTFNEKQYEYFLEKLKKE